MIKIHTLNLDVGNAQFDFANNEITHIGNATAANGPIRIATKTAIEITGNVNATWTKTTIDGSGFVSTNYGTFGVSAGGAITQSSTSSIKSISLQVSASAKNADNSYTNHDITLNSQNNQIARIYTVTGRNFTLVSKDDLVLGIGLQPGGYSSTVVACMSVTGTADLTLTNGKFIQETEMGVGTLKISAMTDVSLIHGLNRIDKLGTVTIGSGRDFTFSTNNADGLILYGNITTTGNVNLNNNTGGIKTAEAIAAIGTQAAVPAVKISAYSLSGTASGEVNLLTSVDRLGNLTLTNSKDNNGVYSSNHLLKLTNDRALTITGAVKNLGGEVNLTVAGGILSTISDGVTPGGKIHASSLSGSAASTVDIATNIDSLGAFTVTGGYDFSLTNDKALIISNALALTNTAVGGLAGNVTLGSVSGANGISVGNAGSITANDLTLRSSTFLNMSVLSLTGTVSGTAGGFVAISGSFAGLGSFSQTANGGFSITNTRSMVVKSSLNRTNGATGAVSLTVTGTTTPVGGTAINNSLTISSAYNAGAANVTLSAAGAVTLGGDLTTTGVVSLTSTAGGITTAAINAGASDVTLSAVGAVALSGNLSTTGTISLTSTGGGISTAGINAGASNVSLSAAGAVALSGNLSTTGTVSVTTTGGGIATAGINAGTANVTLSATGAVALNGNIATTGTVSLTTTADGITTGGYGTGDAKKITAGTLKGSAAGHVLLATNITSLGAFAVTGGGNFTLTNGAALTVTGAVSLTNAAVGGTAGNVSLTSTGATAGVGNGIVISTATGLVGSITANGLAIASAGAVSLTGLTLTGAITGTVAGAVSLTNVSANFSNLQQTENGTFSLISNVSLTSLVAPNRAAGKIGDVYYEVTGAATTMTFSAAAAFGTNNVTLKSATGLTINQNITTSGTLNLISAGGGITIGNIGATNVKAKINAATLSGSAAGAVDITSNINNLGAFTVTGGGNFTLVNDGALTVNGAVTLSNAAVGGSAGNITLTATTGAIALNAAVTGGDVSLTASGVGGKITQTAAVTASGTLSATTMGAVALNGVTSGTNNAIAKLGVIRGAGVTINNAAALTLTGNITSTGGAITIDNSFGSNGAAKNLTLGQNIVISGGDIFIDLGGGTHSATHTTGSGGGTFATNGKTLTSFTTGNSAIGNNLTVFAEDITYAAANTIYIETGDGVISTFRGTAEYSVNSQGVFVIGSDYVLNPTTTYAKSEISYDNVLVGKEFTAGNVHSTKNVLSIPIDIKTVNFKGDIYVNSATALNGNYTSITSTGGRVYFVGNAGYTNSNSLIVSAANGISINSIVNVGANKLTLTTGRGGVVGSGVITAGTLTTTNDAAIPSVTGSGVVGGINLTGANQIGTIGDLINRGGGVISIKNSQATNVASGSTWSNKNGMIIVKLTTGNLNLLGDMTIATGTTALRVDLASAANITGTKIITAKGVDVYYSGKSDGNNVKFNLGAVAAATGVTAVAGGTFTHVVDISGSSPVTIDKTAVGGNVLTLGTGAGVSGITILYDDVQATVNSSATVGKGVRYGTTVAVTIDGNWGAATATNNGSLRWIEGGTINVKPNASFAGSIVLAATGSAATPTVAGNATTNDIFANLYVAGNLTAAKDVILLQTGNVTPPALLASGKTASNAPGADAYGIYVGGAVTATSGSVIMAQTGAVTANSGSAWGIKANNIIYGKIGVDIYNGGAVTAAQTLSNLSVSAYGVQLIGAVWTGGNLAANSVGINNNGDVKANILSDATAYGSMAASVFTTSATNSADATINANAAAEAVRALSAAIAGTAAGSKPSISITVSGTATTYDLSTTLGYNNAYAASVTKYKNENASLKTNLINSNKATLLFAGKAVSATGVSTGNVTSGSVSIGNNANVTDNVDVSGAAITSSKIPTVSSTGLALGVLTASQGRVVVSHAGAVSGITSATGINLVAATGIGVAQVTRPAASPLGNIAAVTGGVSMSASGDVSATAATSTAKGINVLGAVTATLGKVDISQDGAVSGGVLASGITLVGVTSIGSIQTSSGAANALTTNHAVAGGIEIRQNGSVTGNDANGILVYGAITGVNAAVTVKTGVAAIGDETATSPAKIVLAKTGKAYGMNLLGAVTTVGHASNVVASITIGQYATVTADNSSATGLNTGVVILANGTTSSTVNLSNSGNVTANQSKANRSVSATGISTTYVYGGNLSGNSVTITNNGVVKANNVSDATADSYVTDIGVRNWADANAVSSFNLAAQTAANKAISANATSIMIGSTTYNLGTTALNNTANAAYVTQYKTDNANDLVVLKRNNAAQYILNGAVVTAAGVNTGTVIAGGNLKIENKNTVSHGVNETAVNYVVTATGLNLLGAMNANAGVVTLNQTAAVTGITGATGINLVAATGIGVAQVTRPAASPLGNIAAVTGGVLMSASGDVTATSSTSTAKGINVIAAVTAVNGTVKISQDGAVSGGVLASGITLVGVTSIGAIQISSGPANALTKNHAVAGGIEIRQNGTVTGNNGDANGIVSYGGITGVNGTVTVKTGVDTIGAITASATAKTIKAKTGKAFGMNLLGAVTTVGHAGNVDASITIGQYATVTADKGSATGLNTGVVILANGTTSSTVNLSNNGDVTANQSKANRSVSATGISTAYVYGGNLATNTVTITNNGLVTAKNVSDSEADSYVTDIGVRNWADANAVNSINLAANLAADKAINDAIAANQTAISFGTNTNVSISTVAAKTSARTAYITWYKDSRATELTNLKRSNAAQYILNGAVVTATGVNTGTVIAGGNLKIENKNTVSHGVNETAVNYVVTATGLNLLGAMNANAGVVTLNQTAAVTGITGATGINLVAATGIGVAQVTRPAASPLGNIAAVTGGVLMSASGDVTATSSTSTAKGINVIAAVTAVNGTVKISQDGAVSGGVLASGITLVGVTSIGAVETSFGPANALTKNHAVAGGIEIRQNGTVTGNNGDANGIVSYGGITGINGTVTVKTGVAAIGDETATSPAKTVLAKSGKAYGMNLLGAVTTVGYASNVVASITVAQNATVTSEKGSATGLNTGVVILANGTTTSKVDLSNNGDVTATQSKYYLPASATGVASVYVYGGNMSGNHVNITNNGVVTAKDAIANTAKSDAANKFNTQATNAAHAAVNVIPQGASAKINIGGTDYPLTNNRDAEAAKTAYIANYLATNSDVLSYVATRKTAIALVSAVVTAAGVNTGTVIAGGNLTIENKNKVWHGTNDTDVNYVVTATGLNLLGSMIANAGVVTLNQNAAVSGITGATGINLVAATGIGVAQVTRPAGSPLGNIAAVTGGVLMSASGDVTATSSTSTAKGINLIAAVTAVNGTVKISQDGAVSGGVLASGITLVGVTSIGAIQTSSGPANALTTNHAVAGGIEIRQNGDVTGNAGNAGDANGIVSYGGITGINGTVTVKTAVDSTGASTTKTIKAKVGKAFGINLVGQVTTVGHASNVVASIIVAQNAAVTADVNSATGLNTGVVILANGTSSSAVNLSNNGAVNATQSKANRSVSATGVASVYVYGGNISGNSVTIQNTKSVTANNVAATGAITAVDLLNGVVSATGIRAGTVIAGGNLTIENTSTGAVSHGSVDAAPNYLVSATGINVTGALIATLGQISVKQGGAVTGVTSATGISMISATGSGIAGVSYTTQIGNGVATSTAVTSAVTSAISISGNGNVSASGATSTAKGIVVLGNLIGTQGAVSVTLGTSTTTGTVSGGASATGISVVNVNATGSATKIETKVVTAPAPSSTTTTTVTTTTALAGDITITQKGDVSVSAVSAGSATGVVGNALTAALGSVSVTAGAVTGVSSATTGVGNTATGINLTGVATATNANAVNGTTITAGNTRTTTNLSAVTGSIVSLNQTGDVIVNGSGTVGEAKAIVTSVLSGASGVSVVQNGAVTGKSDAYGILVNGAILSNSGVVRVKSGVSLITDTTVPATAKIITAKNGKAYGIKLADVNTARAVGVTADGSITVGQYATVTADKSSATGVTLANVILANGTANSTINLSNNGAVTAKQSVANPLVTAIGVAVNGAVVGGNMAGNNVTITNGGVVAAKTSADVIVPTSSFDIKAVASITANTVGNTLSLNAIGNIDATGAVIIAKTVTASSGTAVNVGGKVSLNNGGNQIANFGAITAGSFDIGSAIDFNLTGDLTKTSTVAGSLMKLSNYGSGKNIGISSNINANRASGADQLTFKFTGTGKFLTTAGQGNIHYVNAGVAESPDLNGTSLNARLTTAVANSVVVTNK